jgi:hypothetical protein
VAKLEYDRLAPTLACLSDKAVLIQAWKKTAAYIRYHNWFSDTLELDRVAINLPEFIANISSEIASGELLRSDPIRMVPAPKSQRWHIAKSGEWQPADVGISASKIRPLAHVSLRDQVIATAIMMCLADRVETVQGDPEKPILDYDIGQVVSYGNRLFSDFKDGEARHRWGSGTLYRGFYQDYQAFLFRPEKVAERTLEGNRRTFVVQADLRQFYDRVTPVLLNERITALQKPGDDPAFFAFATEFLLWNWDSRDLGEVQLYAHQAKLPDFSKVVLPQGLVSAGFFANVSLLSFDEILKISVGRQIAENVLLHDSARYVDDLRFVVSVPDHLGLGAVEERVSKWASNLLDAVAPGLTLAPEKTLASAFRADERPLVQQSKKMARIQAAISGGFDPIGGGEILDSVMALVRSQERLVRTNDASERDPFLPVPDVRDSTVDRFAAGRFRKTYRSLRPLLWSTEGAQSDAGENDGQSQFKGVRTQSELDEEARAFSLTLVSKWVSDPSNVRLLRIALDVWPAADVLAKVLGLLRPFTEKGGRRNAPRRVAWYCLAEIFRAGATETGFVDDAEQLPDALNINEYRDLLRDEAKRIVALRDISIPWYLKQQSYLLLATRPSSDTYGVQKPGKKSAIEPYRELIRFLLGDFRGLATTDFATTATLARRAFLTESAAVQIVEKGLTPARLNRIASLDPDFASEIIEAHGEYAVDLTPRLTSDLSFGAVGSASKPSLSSLVMSKSSKNSLRNEYSLLTFARAFLNALREGADLKAAVPAEITLTLSESPQFPLVVDEVHLNSRNLAGTSLYEVPEWVPEEDAWRVKLGFLLRFILTAQRDFTRPVRAESWKAGAPIYRTPGSHWYQRMYGLFNGHAAFGDDWLAISDWTERLLFGLLWWPGCGEPFQSRQIVGSLESTLNAIEGRIGDLTRLQGSSALLMPLRVPRLFPERANRPMRACVVQTVIPGQEADFDTADLTMSSPTMRRRHRRHLSAALAAVERSLALRETHLGRDGRLDWLILPELAVHPDDVQTHLIPFARAHRAIILAGLTYEELFAGEPLVNSALWILPTQDVTRGLQVLVRRQGKKHLAPAEETFNQGVTRVQGFRPCQWLIGYQWSRDEGSDPLWLSAAICFDATDICLAADLKGKSDIFAIPALNRDVATYDNLSMALHYHMYQMVVVANNGVYGGSNAYAPFRESYNRQVFHMHGQPQASIAFFEIDQVGSFKARLSPGTQGDYQFKPAPAG